MSKDKDLLSQIGEIYTLYKLRWLIVIGVVILGILFWKVSSDLDKEYQKYGYKGYTDNVKRDEWTDEIIPKDQISTYNNDSKYIVKTNGEKVYFSQIKEQLNAYEQLQGPYAFIKVEK